VESLRVKEEEAAVRRYELSELNKLDMGRRERIAGEERAMDMAILEATLTREAAEDAADEEAKAAYAAEQQKFQASLAGQAQADQADEALLDRMREAQTEDEWEKKLVIWGAEQDARERLRSHVEEERAKQIQYKYDRAEREAQIDVVMKERLAKEAAYLAREQVAREKTMAEEGKKTAAVIREQIRLKEIRLARDAGLAAREKNATIHAERQYQARLQAEKDRMYQTTMALTQGGSGSGRLY